MSKKSQKQKVSDFLANHGSATASHIAHELKLTVAAVHRRIYDLREDGERIESESYRWAGATRVRYHAA
jgi:predicted ArsR family transcriptional regulator